MLNNLVMKLKFLGVIPQAGCMEYGFRIENEDKSYRLVVLSIKDTMFQQNNLLFQEAPDLCYQKVLADLDEETTDSPIPARIPVTAEDIVKYRDLHPNAKLRRKS
jgi:hypothetical protein